VGGDLIIRCCRETNVARKLDVMTKSAQCRDGRSGRQIGNASISIGPRK